MSDTAPLPRATPASLGAIPAATDNPDRRRHVVSGGGLYLTWKQAALVIGIVASTLGIAKGVWPVVAAAATIPATVDRINASTTRLVSVVEALQRDQAGVQRDQVTVRRDVDQLRASVDQVSTRVGVLEPVVAAGEAIRTERARQVEELQGRVRELERDQRGAGAVSATRGGSE